MKELFKDLIFEEENHEYFYKGVKCGISGTSLIHQYANEFDESKFSVERVTEWHEERDYSCIKGNEIHLYCQGLWNGAPYNTNFSLIEPRFRNRLHLDLETLKKQATAFYEDYNDMLELIKDEQLIYDNDYDVAGAIDLLFRNKFTGDLVICDLKSNKEIKYEAFKKKTMKIPLTELQDCNFIHYSLQVYLYKTIFEKNTGLTTEEPFIIHFDVTKDNYTFIEPKKLDKEILKILEMRRRNIMKIVIIMGGSGTGKTFSFKNLPPQETAIISVAKTELPYKNKNNVKFVQCEDYEVIKKSLKSTNKKILVVDDASFLTQFETLKRAMQGSEYGKKENSIAKNFYELLQISREFKADDEKILYITMHERKNDAGIIAPRTCGNSVDDRINVEGQVNILFRSLKKDNDYVFQTQNNGDSVCKTPYEMFEEEFIPNDLLEIDKKIREYYGYKPIEIEKEIKKEEEIK